MSSDIDCEFSVWVWSKSERRLYIFSKLESALNEVTFSKIASSFCCCSPAICNSFSSISNVLFPPSFTGRLTFRPTKPSELSISVTLAVALPANDTLALNEALMAFMSSLRILICVSSS